ncbi:DNA mismatch repair protein MutL [Kineothrix alysoides]|uniref:DNA mismatch repair protein MutL n=1 Tax=Kineothrix alysoides TaxID=1469948 RepID=A0A4R1R000_9FIRM|nr:DNA mismatch repair endonuclease MutL [Kineothrix alysoides]TCL58581.1 DNA mismatch repair protein MutL [Kineothrix alysoides]
MAQINVLSKDTIDKIAAGEVVERPASVVKELLENAIDAGASVVTVEIKEGGISLIRVTDNGCGIDKSEVSKAFLRHATSKINSVEDLMHIASLGFRGEALSSIAAVSKLELITKTKDELTGIRYAIEGGWEKESEEIGAPNGTTILVRNLFFNTPVRKKFLKQPQTEGSYVSDLMEHMALSNPGVSFKYINNGQTRFYTSGNGNLQEIIYRIYGKDISSSLIPVDISENGIHMSGFIGKPEINRANRSFEIYFVNGRFIKSGIIGKAIEEGYKKYVMQHKFPFVVLHLQIDSQEMDVNVHPTKMEVRFTNQMKLYDFISEHIIRSLHETELIPAVILEERKKEAPEIIPSGMIPEPFESRRLHSDRGEGSVNAGRHMNAENYSNAESRVSVGNPMSVGSSANKEASVREKAFMEKENFVREENTYGETSEKNTATESDFFVENRILPKKEETQQMVDKMKDVLQNPLVGRIIGTENRSDIQDNAKTHANIIKAGEHIFVEKPTQLNLFEEKMLTEEARAQYRIMGQIFDTYWLVSFSDKLFIIDQHAAHEKVKYEKFIKELEERQVQSQLLEPPVIVTLSGREESILKEYEESFTDMGFEIELFGGNEYAIRSVPAELYGCSESKFFTEMLDELAEGVPKGTPAVVNRRIATMACKAAVKGNMSFSMMEMEALIDELLVLEDPYHCPHGRPTIISMSKYELEKKFKRIV